LGRLQLTRRLEAAAALSYPSLNPQSPTTLRLYKSDPTIITTIVYYEDHKFTTIRGDQTSMAAMFSQNPLMNGPNYSFNEAPRAQGPEGAREHRFDP